MVEIETFVRHFLAVYFLMIGLYYASRSYAMSEREGFSFIAYGQRFSAGWWHRQLFNVFRAGILLVCVARLFLEIDPYLGRIDVLYIDGVLLLGVIVLLAGYSIVSYVAGYMHRDWFSGIAPQCHEQHLITRGPFARSRNPLFIGILLGQLGFFLALPSLFSLVCLLVGVWVIRRQAILEESALLDRYGVAYQAYRDATPRWGRLIPRGAH